MGSCRAAQVVLQAFPDAPLVFSSLDNDEEAGGGEINGSIPCRCRQRRKAHGLLVLDVADVIELHCQFLFKEDRLRERVLSYPCVTHGPLSALGQEPDSSVLYEVPLLWATAAYWREVVAGAESAPEYSDTLYRLHSSDAHLYRAPNV